MKLFDPKMDVENSRLILDNGSWPNFHDAEVHSLSKFGPHAFAFVNHVGSGDQVSTHVQVVQLAADDSIRSVRMKLR